MKEKEEVPNASNRRSFLKGAGMTGLSLAGAAIIGTTFASNPQKAEAATAVSDIDILNFALNVEYLEAEFYAKSTFGATLVQLGVISAADESGPTTGGAKVPNFGASPAATMATALRIDEINHVNFLHAALGLQGGEEAGNQSQRIRVRVFERQ